MPAGTPPLSALWHCLLVMACVRFLQTVRAPDGVHAPGGVGAATVTVTPGASPESLRRVTVRNRAESTWEHSRSLSDAPLDGLTAVEEEMQPEGSLQGAGAQGHLHLPTSIGCVLPAWLAVLQRAAILYSPLLLAVAAFAASLLPVSLTGAVLLLLAICQSLRSKSLLCRPVLLPLLASLALTLQSLFVLLPGLGFSLPTSWLTFAQASFRVRGLHGAVLDVLHV